MKRLGGWDAMLLYSEAPNVHTHTLKVAVLDASGFDGDYTFEHFRETVSGRLHLMEPLRYRLVDIPWQLHHPMWQENSDVDLDYHLRRAQVASPGGRRELDELIGRVASTPLDRSRPLWEFHFVEGMADRKFAVIGKVHHALADGVASGNLMARAMNRSGAAQDEHADGVADEVPTGAELVRAAGRDHLRQIVKLPKLMGYTASNIARTRRHAKKREKDPALARNFHAPDTFINHVISAERTFASATLALADVKQVGRELGVTINDMVLAISAGALRNLLLRYDGHADEPIIASVPTSLDLSPDRVTGNRLGGLLVSLPVQIADPLERVRLAHLGARVAKEDYQVLGPDLPTRWAAYLPPAMAPAAFSLMAARQAKNTVMTLPISNVPGPRERGGLADLVLSEIYSVGPLVAGSGMNITVWSYADQLNFSVLADDQTFKDTHEATEALIESFAEIRSAAGFPGPLTALDTAMAPAAAAH